MNGFEPLRRRIIDYTEAGQWSEVYDGPLEECESEKLKVENKKLHELIKSYITVFYKMAKENNGNGPYFSGEDWLSLANDMRLDLAECDGELLEHLSNSEETLKPCPFCGGKAHLVNDNSARLGKVWSVWHTCDGFKGRSQGYGGTLYPFFETPWYNDKQTAIDAWNNRRA